jgi:hypothetical protein
MTTRTADRSKERLAGHAGPGSPGRRGEKPLEVRDSIDEVITLGVGVVSGRKPSHSPKSEGGCRWIIFCWKETIGETHFHLGGVAREREDGRHLGLPSEPAGTKRAVRRILGGGHHVNPAADSDAARVGVGDDG